MGSHSCYIARSQGSAKPYLGQGSDGVVKYHLHGFLLLQGVKVENGAVPRVRLGHVPGICFALPVEDTEYMSACCCEYKQDEGQTSIHCRLQDKAPLRAAASMMIRHCAL